MRVRDLLLALAIGVAPAAALGQEPVAPPPGFKPIRACTHPGHRPVAASLEAAANAEYR